VLSVHTLVRGGNEPVESQRGRDIKVGRGKVTSEVTHEKVIGTTHEITNEDAKVFGTKKDVKSDQRHGGMTKRK
jgi:hypothetical protein